MRLLTLSLIVSICSSLNAALVERDLYDPGDGLLTYDNVNRREWLDITATLNWSLLTLQESLAKQGSLHGFNLATLADLQGLASSAGISWFSEPLFPGADGPSAWNLLELVGDIPLWEEETIPSGGACLLDVVDGNSHGGDCGSAWMPDYDDLVELNPLEILNLRLAPGFFNVGTTIDASGLAMASVFSFGEPSGLPGQVNNPLYGTEWRSGGITL